MKTNLSILGIIIITIILGITSCKPKKTIVNTTCPGYKSLDFNRKDILANGIGIMPVLGGNEKEQFRRPMGDEITKYMRMEFGNNRVKSPRDVINVLNDAKLSDEYSEAIRNYRVSGIVPKELLSQLGKALSVRFLLYTHLLTDEEVRIQQVGEGVQVVEVDELYAQSQVWDAQLGDIVWEGKGGYAMLANNKGKVTSYDIIVERTAESISKTIGNEKGDGPCEDKEEIYKSVRKATMSTVIGISGGTAVALIIFLIIAL